MSKKKIGFSIGGLQAIYGDKRALEIAAEIGADCVDFATDGFGASTWDYRNPASIYAQGDEAIVEYYSELRKHAEGLGIWINQTHGRGDGFKNKKEEDDALVENARLDLLAASALGADTCVIHNVTSIFMGANPDPRLMRDLSFDQYMRMLPYAAKYGVKLATETFGDAVRYSSVDFFGDIKEFMMNYNRIKAASEHRDFYTTCVDTGHSNKAMRYGNPTPADVIRMIGRDISVLHLNDNDTFTDQHKIPMTGCIDWNDVLNALDEVGYKGVYNLELNLRNFGDGMEIEMAAFGLKVLRHMLEGR